MTFRLNDFFSRNGRNCGSILFSLCLLNCLSCNKSETGNIKDIASMILVGIL